MTVVLCSKGYPKLYKKNKEIKRLRKINLKKKSFIYHAGTAYHNGKVYSSGGRVLNITSVGKNFKDIRDNILKILKHINWKHGFYRKDIGWRVIKKKWESLVEI